MANVLIAAPTGYGKGYVGQAVTENNIKTGPYDCVMVFDYADEFKGLVKGGLAKYWKVGPVEATNFERHHWEQLLDEDAVVLARHPDVRAEQWREIVAEVVAVIRTREEAILSVIDEADEVAPKDGKVPDEIDGLASEGRDEGNGKSAVWITQRLQMIDEVAITQSTTRYFGAVGSSTDRNKIAGEVDYPKDIHKPGGVPVHLDTDLWEDLLAPDEGAISLRKFTEPTDEDGETRTLGSEWIVSKDSGEAYRLDSRKIVMDCEHMAGEGKDVLGPALEG